MYIAEFTQQISVVAIKLAWLFSIAIIVLLVAEGILRLLVPSNKGKIFLFTPESMRYKVMKPNSRAIVYGVPFQTNELGFRDRVPGSPVRAPGEKRVIVLGDSYTAAAGVALESTYTDIAERELASLSGNPRVKVMNLATGGYNVLQFWYTLTESGLSLSPDYVVAAVVVAEDFDRMDLYAECRRIAMGGTPNMPGWFDRLYLTRVFWQRFYNLIFGALLSDVTAPVDSAAASENQNSHARDGIRINEQALLDIQSALAQRDIPLLVVFLPAVCNFSVLQSAHSQRADFCRSHNIEFIDTLPAFISDGHKPRYFGLNIIDNHPNENYHRIVGRALANALASDLAGRPRQGTNRS